MQAPETDLDLFSAAGFEYPYENYRQIRDLGPLVFLSRIGIYAMGRYSDVKAALGNHHGFVSGQGVAVTEASNANMRGTTLASDSPLHEKLRRIIGAPLQPAALALLRAQFETAASTPNSGSCCAAAPN